MTDIEIWKPVVGHEGFYEVSDHGRVRSLDREIPHGRYPGVMRRRRGMILRPRITQGYNYVQFGRTGNVKVSCLVALTFLGPRPKGHDVCHNDGNRLNDRADNLRYDTRAGNFADKHTHGTMICGERHKGSRLKKDDVKTIIKMHGIGMGYGEIARKYGVGRSTVRDVVKRYTWASNLAMGG